MGEKQKLITTLAVIFAVVSLGVGGYIIKHRSSTVHFVNALDEPVHVTVAEHDFDLIHNQRVSKDLPKGPHQVRVAFAGKDGKVIEQEQIDVPGGYDAVVYNVAGAAPIYRASVTYTSSSIAPAETQEMVGGPRFWSNNHVNYVFTDPPKSIKLSKGSTRQVNYMVTLPEKLDWIDTIIALAKNKQEPLAVEVASRIALLHPDKIEHVSRVIYALGLAGLSGATAELAQKLIVAAPQSLEAHRFYQSALLGEGKRDKLIEEYQRRLEADSGSAEALYLLLRVLPKSARTPQIDKAVAAFPDDGKLRYLQILDKAESHDPKGIEELVKKLAGVKLDPQYMRVIAECAANLRVEAGDAKRALAELDRAHAGGLFTARVEKLVTGKVPADELTSIGDPVRSALANVYLEGDGATQKSGAESEATKKAFLQFSEAVGRGRQAAINAFLNGKVEPGSVSVLGQAVAYPLAAALIKRGQTKPAEALVAGTGMTNIAQGALIAMVLEGKPTPELDETDMDRRAAIRLALAIHTDDKAKQKELLAAALKDEPIPGPVHLIAKTWF